MKFDFTRYFSIAIIAIVQSVHLIGFAFLGWPKMAYPFFNWELFAKPLPIERHYTFEVLQSNNVNFSKPVSARNWMPHNFNRYDFVEQIVDKAFKNSNFFMADLDDRLALEICQIAQTNRGPLKIRLLVENYSLGIKEKIFRAQKTNSVASNIFECNRSSEGSPQ